MKVPIFSISKLILPFSLAGLGAYGIFSSWMLSLIIGFIASLIFLVYKFDYRPRFIFHESVIKKIGKYSFGNYIAGFIGGLPTLLLPLIITKYLHPEITAYYYMAMMIATTLFIIPNSTSNSLFAEGSYHEEDLRKHVKKAIKLIALFMIPAIIITIFFGKYVLLLFGKAYSSEGYIFLDLLAINGIFVSVNAIFASLFRVKKRIKEMILIGIINAIVILGLSFLLIHMGWGLIGIGGAYLIGQAVISGVYTIKWMIKNKEIKKIEKGRVNGGDKNYLIFLKSSLFLH